MKNLPEQFPGGFGRCAGLPTNATVYVERPLPGSEPAAQAESANALNTVFIVAFALFISFLAMRLARRGRKK